ncbi:hypothetical protein [Archangium sp.]|uniref:hypothetical protein n=1 Tax=Archangium sp. TaxID=1872627 RepID=UPI002D40831B|nr:hypothetical protein [Archangium sp.]HYO53014.1 hypothetical protein [Archangium sp.]
MLMDLPPAYHLVLQQLPSGHEAQHAQGNLTVAPAEPARPAAAAHRMGTHGMVLFGSGKRLFLSHIPMFHRPHDVQLLASVSLAHPELPAGRDFSDGTYTLEPERFDLDALAQGKLKQFRATVHRGNFEGGGTPLHRDVTVRVEKVEQVRLLDRQAPELPELRYWVVGSGKEAWLVHALSRAPDFDQVVKVSLDKPLPRKGTDLPVLRFPGRKNLLDERLEAGERLTATGEDGQPVRLTIQREHSLLKGPDFTP